MKTAAILVIGNEILSAKIQDKNAYYLSQRLRQLGTSLEKMVFILDRYDDIKEEILALSQRFDVVFTSGGVGPTHDDITLEAIAKAFGVGCYLDEKIKAILAERFAEQLNDAHLRMAYIPIGSELIWENNKFPVYSFKNIYILPGVPHIFVQKFESIAHLFKDGQFYLRNLYFTIDEAFIAKEIEALERQFHVIVGSYPVYNEDFKVKITIESRDATQVNLAVDFLLSQIGNHHLLRMDQPF